MLPLAAAGSIAPMTRAWVRKVSAWMLALICYKPAAAAVYATAFTMIGSGGSPETALMGFVMLLLSVLTLPALMRFFTWTTGAIASSAGGGQLLGAATVGAIAIGAMRTSGGGSAQDQAAFLDSRLGPQPPGGSGGALDGGPSPVGPRPDSGGPGPMSDASAPGAAAGPFPTSAATGSAWTAGAGSTGASAGAVPPGAADPATSGAAGAATTVSGSTASTATPASAAGPAASAAAAGAQIAADAARLATGAMEEGDPR